LMTPDHVAVTPYFEGPQTIEQEIAALSELDYKETMIGDVNVVLLAPDVAMRTFVADLEGNFKGKPLPARVFVTETLVNRNGQWLERFFQSTAPQP
jgi:cellobiose-specific phosphotransferase system component IIB